MVSTGLNTDFRIVAGTRDRRGRDRLAELRRGSQSGMLPLGWITAQLAPYWITLWQKTWPGSSS